MSDDPRTLDDLYDTIHSTLCHYMSGDGYMENSDIHNCVLAIIDAYYNWQLANGYVIKAPFPPDMEK